MNFDLSNTNNTIRKCELGFHKLISSLENNGVHGANDFTVFELYQRMEYYDELHQKLLNKQNNS